MKLQAWTVGLTATLVAAVGLVAAPASANSSSMDDIASYCDYNGEKKVCHIEVYTCENEINTCICTAHRLEGGPKFACKPHA